MERGLENELRTMHLFAGIGGGLLADLILGHRPIIAVEWDKYACRILRERATDGWFPDLSVWEGDVRLFDPSEYAGRVDCIHAGFPCQDISVAGKQAGLGESTRSGLYREVLRIAGVVRPRYLFLENVSAILSNGLGCVLGDLAAMGYDCRWLCIRASDVGAPHGRDRWFCLGYSEHDGHFAKPQLRSDEKTGDEEQGVFRDSDNSQQRKEQEIRSWQANSSRDSGIPWWETECLVGRVVDGDTDRAHRLKGLGNAQVPLQAATAWRILTHNVESERGER